MTSRLNQLVASGLEFISKLSEEEMRKKEHVEKWSRKEILGHLIDSAINNLQRFTEVQFKEKPYKVETYNQNELVIANDYQRANTKNLLDFWESINKRIGAIIENQTDETLKYKVQISNTNIVDLQFLMQDYIDHLEHHLKQIKAL
ncbi:DinB family protein [Tenacibaculum agarivorans]|uniref:DinB family protein n=1 Tax=Tenacibaculum agarivorans TaxID=1908389 RepID=UPI00094BB8D0|nr:DinB family protein [Tenacibaculum agarivorans]